MNPDDAAEAFVAGVQTALLQASSAAMGPLARAIEARISVPVGPNGERSKPGEPPRRDTGALLASVDVQAVESSDRIRVSVSVDTPYAERLNEEMNRPIAGDEFDRHLPEIVDALADAITAKFS